MDTKTTLAFLPLMLFGKSPQCQEKPLPAAPAAAAAPAEGVETVGKEEPAPPAAQPWDAWAGEPSRFGMMDMG